MNAQPATLAVQSDTSGCSGILAFDLWKMTCTKSKPLGIFENLIGQTAAVERPVAAVSRQFRAAAMTALSLPAPAAPPYFLMRAMV